MNEFIIPENFNLDLDWYKIEVLASNRKLTLCDYEANLFLTKWFDYRLFHPVISNIIFFQEYQWCYKKYHKKYIDSLESLVKRGVKQKELYDNVPATINACIKARIEADKMGIPYGLYCSYAIRILMEEHLWQHLPLISQITMPFLVTEIQNEWEENQSINFLYPMENYFLAKNYCGDIVQEQFKDYLLSFENENVILFNQFKKKGYL